LPVYSVRERHSRPEDTPHGRAIIEAIWRDMTQFEGYSGTS
jgi:hypothetical protein